MEEFVDKRTNISRYLNTWKQIKKVKKELKSYDKSYRGFVKTRSLPKYFYFHNGKYTVQKYTDGHMATYGSYVSEEDARKVVAELKKCDWDKNQLSAIRERLGV